MQPDYKTKHGRVQGEIWQKTIHGSKHFLQKPPAIAFDLADLAAAERAGAVRVDVFDADTGTHYRAALSHIREHGFVISRGYGRQIALPLSGFLRSGPNLAPDVIAPVQLSFLAGARHE